MDELLVEIGKRLESEYLDKYVDEEFLRWIFNSVVEIQGTHEHVCNGFEMGGRAPFILASGGYNKVEKKIQFFDMAFSMAKNEVYNDMKIGDDNKNRFIAANILMINTLLHELEHVKQEDKRKEDSFEGYLLRSEEGKEETISSYDFIPGERFAENIAVKETLTILNNMGIIVPEIYDYMEKRRNLWIIRGYVDELNQCMVYPVKRYMDNHGVDFADMSLEEAVAKYPELEDRLFYGLPISEDEYFQVRAKAGLVNTRTGYSLW